MLVREWGGEKLIRSDYQYRVSFWSDENVLKLDCGDDCMNL